MQIVYFENPIDGDILLDLFQVEPCWRALHNKSDQVSEQNERVKYSARRRTTHLTTERVVIRVITENINVHIGSTILYSGLM